MWSEEVHQNRVLAAVTTARQESRLKKNGAKVPVTPNQGSGGFLVAVGAVVGLVGFRLYERQLRQIKWKQLPVIRQFHQLLSADGFSTKTASQNVNAKRPQPRPAAAPAKVSASGKAKPVAKVSDKLESAANAWHMG